MHNHKQLATELFDRLSASDPEGALALLTDDVSWRLPGKPDLFPSAGIYDKARLRRLFARMYERLEQGLRMTVVSTIAEGDRMAIEVESTADLKNGRQYRQEYHFRMEFRGGKICSVREYVDTQHAWDVWFKP